MVLEGVAENSPLRRERWQLRVFAACAQCRLLRGLILILSIALPVGVCSSCTKQHAPGAWTPPLTSESAHRIILHVDHVEPDESHAQVVSFAWSEASETGLPTVLSGPLRVRPRFGEALVGANIDLPEGTSAAVDIRVLNDRARFISPWLRLAAWGDSIPPTHAAAAREFADARSGLSGKVNVDCFESSSSFDALEYRITASTREARIRRVSVVLTDTQAWVGRNPAWRPQNAITLDVPFRSQQTPDPTLSGRLCSPTSVAMVLAYQGVDVPVIDVARRAYDPVEYLYGNWPHNVQAAHTFGAPATLARFDRWSDVERVLASGQPIIASIAAGLGELRGAPYPKTGGHLIVLRGMTGHGDVLVNDPAVSTAALGQLIYLREDLTNVWMHHSHGTAYIIKAHEHSNQTN